MLGAARSAIFVPRLRENATASACYLLFRGEQLRPLRGLLMRCVVFSLAALTLSFAAAPAFGEVRPVSVDRTMQDLLGEDRAELLLEAGKLNLSKLDYSLESLAEIDAWLEVIHQTNLAEVGSGKAGQTLKRDGRGVNSITLAGLYLGETVKRNSDLGWAWVPFDEFVSQNPVYAEHYGNEAGLDTYVLVGRQGAATPMNSALKRILNGRADSIAYIGEFLSQPIAFDKVASGYEPGPEPRVVKRRLETFHNGAIEDADEKVNELLRAIRAADAGTAPAGLYSAAVFDNLERDPWLPKPYTNAFYAPGYGPDGPATP